MPQYNRYWSPLLNGGCEAENGATYCGIYDSNDLKTRCTRVQTDFAFEFIACAFGLGALFISYSMSRRVSTHY